MPNYAKTHRQAMWRIPDPDREDPNHSDGPDPIFLCEKQCYGSGSLLDPYSWAFWIRIRIQNPDPAKYLYWEHIRITIAKGKVLKKG